MPTISIIVPIYNVDQYLHKCIDSILNQSFQQFELLLINDGSTDQSGEICDEYSLIDDRIRVIHKENGGVSSARNIGIDMADGEYIAFVDPDDTIDPNMYEVLLNSAASFCADMTVCPIKTINEITGSESVSQVWKEVDCVLDRHVIHEKILPSILQQKVYSLVSSVNKLYRKTLFDQSGVRFDERKHHSEDALLNFTLITKIESLVFVNEPLYNYFIRPRDSLTQKIREDFYEYILDNKQFMIQICKTNGLNAYEKTVINHFTNVAINYIQVIVNSDLPNKRKLEIVSTIVNDDQFHQDIGKYHAPSLFLKLLKYMCLLKSEKLLFLMTYSKGRLQRTGYKKIGDPIS